ncbi:DUF945 family protein [Spiribacter halobius]|uniref:DUF945 domain-containing protein n=1 Tax=Sediminicurvatus halobius TaxID=2182432 RepID=A0A2U2N146_9GAMM|nr:DUF945 family protein [Spiribacter halobius]PWG62782.1 hypothetical protein DEM34_10445 [Spiribacter halobius]UEX77072.1 YdgA family protein [Spiribacter halobius]
MRKRWRYGAAAVILLAAGGAAALPWVNGLRAENAVRAGVAAAESRLAADPRSDASLALVRYQRGPLGGEAVARLRFPESEEGNELRAALGLPPGPSTLDIRLDLEHGLTGVDLTGRLVPEGLVGAVLERLGGNADSLTLRGRVGVMERRLEIASARLAGALDEAGDQQLRVEPLAASLDFDAGSGLATGRLAWDGLTLTAAATDSRLAIGTVAVDGEGTLIAGDAAGGLWAGSSEVRVGPVRLVEDGRVLGAFSSLVIRSQTRRAGDDRLAAELDGTLEGLRTVDADLAGGRLELRADDLSVPGLLALNEAGAQGNVSEEGLAALLAAAPVFRVQALELEGAGGGRLSLTARVALAAGAAERVPGVVASGGQALLPYVDGELALRVDRAISDDLPDGLAGLLGQLQAFGALVAEGDEARLDASLSDGRLTLNGRTWPLF